MSEKAIYDKLVAKVNAIDTSRFALKTKCDTDKSDLEKKIPDANGLFKKYIVMLKSLKYKTKHLVFLV